MSAVSGCLPRRLLDGALKVSRPLGFAPCVVVTAGPGPADSISDVADIVNLYTQNRLIRVLEDRDTTRFGEQGGAVSLDSAVNYRLSVQSALTGQENYIVINIDPGQWPARSRSASSMARWNVG
jgi:hypothetical protein